MLLHGYYRSSASFRVRIALNLKKIEHENAYHHLRKNEHLQPGLSGAEPVQGLLPALEVEGAVLTQSLAILEYLEETHPEPPLLPRDPIGRAHVRALAYAVACDIHPVDNLRILRYLRDPLGHDEPTVQAWYNHWIAEGFKAIETMLAQSPETGRFCHGDAPGLADVRLVPQVVNSTQLRAGPVALSRHPAHLRRLPGHAGVRGRHAGEPAGQGSGLNGHPRQRSPLRALIRDPGGQAPRPVPGPRLSATLHGRDVTDLVIRMGAPHFPHSDPRLRMLLCLCMR